MKQPIVISEVDNTSRPILLFLTENEYPAFAENTREVISFNWNSLRHILLNAYLDVTQNPTVSEGYSQKDLKRLIRKWLTVHRSNKRPQKCGYCRYCNSA